MNSYITFPFDDAKTVLHIYAPFYSVKKKAVIYTKTIMYVKTINLSKKLEKRYWL